MFEAVRRPRNGFEAVGLDRSAVDHTPAECPIVDPPGRVPHLLQTRGVELGFGIVSAHRFVGHTLVGGIARRVDDLIACALPLARGASRQLCFELEQPTLVLLGGHTVGPSSSISSRPVSMARERPRTKYEGLRLAI